MKQNTFVIIDTKKESNILIKVTFMQKQVHCNLPKISENESNSLEGPLTKYKGLSFLKYDKSPGLDGFTCEFFKFFWHDLGSFFTRAINFSKRVKHFSEPNKLGIIACILKLGKQNST